MMKPRRATTFLVVGAFMCGASSLGAAAPDTGATRSEYEVQAQTAGQILRQPHEEAKWTEQLLSLPPLQNQNMDSSFAQNLLQTAQVQSPLINTFLLDIWRKFISTNSLDDSEMLYTSKSINTDIQDDVYEGTHLFIFISETVPPSTIRNYLKDIEGIQATLVLRGLIGDNPGKFSPTQNWIHNILCGTQTLSSKNDCFTTPIDINPNLYRKFSIQVVPTVVYVFDNIKNIYYESNFKSDIVLAWVGDVSLSYVFQQFQKERPLDPILEKYIGHLKGDIPVQGDAQ